MVNFDFWWAVNIINYMYGFVYYAVMWCYVYVFKITTVCTNNNVLSGDVVFCVAWRDVTNYLLLLFMLVKCLE